MIDAAETRAVVEVLGGAILTHGPRVRAFEAAFLCPLHREDEHGACRDRVEHPGASLGEDLAHRRIRPAAAVRYHVVAGIPRLE